MDDISEPIRFAKALANDLEHPGPVLVGLYLHGSACLGGWNAITSDVDLLIVVEDAIERDALVAISREVLAHARHCPGKGVECSIVTRSQAGVIRNRWPFLAHFNSPDKLMPDIFPSPERNDPDLLMHYEVCHEVGIAISGPSTSEIFAPVQRETVLAYLADELIWGLEHAPPRYALLNACRAREYLGNNRIVSKVEAGDDALRRPRKGDPLVEIEAALEEQRGGDAMSGLPDEVTDFIRDLSRDLRNAV